MKLTLTFLRTLIFFQFPFACQNSAGSSIVGLPGHLTDTFIQIVLQWIRTHVMEEQV